jgi:hypothetical protein
MTDVRFARSAQRRHRVRLVGDGPVDLVYVQGSLTQLEASWESS